MMNYIIYTNEYGECIVEMLNEGAQELLSVEKDLIRQGYVISQVIGLFIKCYKVEKEKKDE